MTLVVDAHHHFWDPDRHEYPWMGDALAPIRRRFAPENLAPLLKVNGVDRTVLVQTIANLVETREFLTTAAATEFVAGVVGWVDLTDPGVAHTLADLRGGLGGGFLVGIRHQVHDEPDPGWLLRPEVQRGIQAVGDAGHVYDLLVRARELPAALETARRLPDVRFVIDHIAKPKISAGSDDLDWDEAMAPFSGRANVFCKLSGMVTEAAWASWTAEDLAPYVRRVLGWFGADRCMFGSDWPVCLLAASYDQVMDATGRVLAGVSAADRAAILGGNAVRIYQLTG